MRGRYRERLKAIRPYSIACIGLGTCALAIGRSTVEQIAGGAVLLGGAAAYSFWSVYLHSHPRFDRRQRLLLLMLYAVGTVAFLSVVGATVWSIASRQGGMFHWLIVGIGIVECGEHFGVRWLDGRSHWRVFGSPRHWLGGAAGIALRHRTIRST
jgi:hypothetical protein